MNENFILGASIFCLLVGVSFCWPPIERYRGAKQVGAFGMLLVLCGVVLMTTFKWTEVAIKISDLEFKLAAAVEDARLAKVQLTNNEKAFASFAKQFDPNAQKQAIDAVFHELPAEDAGIDANKAKDAFLDAFERSGIRVVPAGAVDQLTTTVKEGEWG
ncbi:hypothetical protein I7G86_10060 [Sinorhizobium meliloti]|nr:hypothetical protein [Sinorhizobium meliloti]ASP84306.1 hypothetical protein CDO26_06595 [Sinorhizobium meliloti]MCM5692478.1 hypothetical protein [Sinorhizobium meliloti]MDE3766240.1 hypothetical protein [Sinorhizobium meliloti]MDE3781135.1 hypothetical protein [Sinorhizobium meliloti]MDE3784269.1 hypothetical protein [Sinorhizobium meliloti]